MSSFWYFFTSGFYSFTNTNFVLLKIVGNICKKLNILLSSLMFLILKIQVRDKK